MNDRLIDYFAKVRAELHPDATTEPETEPDPARLAARYAHGYQED